MQFNKGVNNFIATMEKLRKSLQTYSKIKDHIKEERNLDLHLTISRADFWLARTLDACCFITLAVRTAPNVTENKAAKEPARNRYFISQVIITKMACLFCDFTFQLPFYLIWM